MSFARTVKNRLRDALPPVAFLALSGYFVWHSLHGDYGLMAKEKRLEDISRAEQVLAQAVAERDAMERKVEGMRGGEMDRDQLDERARALLNMVGRDEIVVPYDPSRRLR